MPPSRTTIDGYALQCSPRGVLQVVSPRGITVSVLSLGTHAALDVFGEEDKGTIVAWWKIVRKR